MEPLTFDFSLLRDAAYLVSAVLFFLGFKRLSSPVTAR